MSDETEQLKKYRREYARLFDPEIPAQVELIPMDDAGAGPATKKRKKNKETSQPARKDFVAASATKGSGSEKSFSEYVQGPKIEPAAIPEPSNSSAIDPDTVQESGPKITISPATLNDQVALFQDQTFEVRARDGEKAELLWQPTEGGVLQRAAMDHLPDGLFSATIELPDGEYLIGYAVDGALRPHPAEAQRLVLRRDGVFTRTQVHRHRREFTIRNQGTEAEVVHLVTDVPWLAPGGSLVVQENASTQFDVRLAPEAMKQGKNEGRLMALMRNGAEETIAAESLVQVTAVATGAIPRLNYWPDKFDWVFQGRGQLTLNVGVIASGRGKLTGMVMVRPAAEVADFQLDAESLQPGLLHTFIVESSQLPYQTEGSIKITVVTDSYLANHRLLQAEVPYKLVYLKKSLPVLAFGTVARGLTRTLRLEVERSDGAEINLDTPVPDHAAHYLKSFRIRPNVCSFQFDTRNLAPGAAINDVVTLTDMTSGLSDQIKVLATVGGR